ncbi:MAG: hypothetical protein KDD47_06190, partial [Acidobacteria bacterium]|nr:hypothetical protein [Acidobacteriota bacterium]
MFLRSHASPCPAGRGTGPLLQIFLLALWLSAGAAWATIDNVTLINADSDQGFAGFDPIAEAATVVSGALPTDQWNLRANVNPGAASQVKSVKFILRLDGADILTRVENVAPYAAYGDVSGDYNGAVFAPGSYELVVSSHTQPGAGGTRLDLDTLHFDVVEGGPSGPIQSLTLVDAVT